MPEIQGEISIIYLHGFQSSSRSQKATALSEHLEQNNLQQRFKSFSPDLPFSPKNTFSKIESLLSEFENPVLMGSSMGGFYASYCSQKFSCPAVLINPVADARFLFADLVGKELANPYTSERYLFDQADYELLIEVAALEIVKPELLAVFLETGDEVLDYRLAQKKYIICRQEIFDGGDHRFQNFEHCLPEMLAFFSEALSRE